MKALIGFISVLAGVFVFIFVIRFAKNHNNKRFEKAIQAGHVVTGKRIKSGENYVASDDFSTQKRYDAVYEFEADGKTYNYRYVGRAHPPVTAKIYYIKSPRRAFSAIDKGKAPSTLTADIALVLAVVVCFSVLKLLNCFF